MTDYRSERRARRHQDLPEAASPPDSGSTPPPSSALSDGGGWKPLDDKARGGNAVTVRSEAGEIAAAYWHRTRHFNPRRMKWEPTAYWRSYVAPIPLWFEPVEYMPI